MKRYVFALAILGIAGCQLSQETEKEVGRALPARSWASNLVHPGLQVQIAPVSERLQGTVLRLPIVVRVRNSTDKPITFSSPIPFPVFHGEISVTAPDGSSAITIHGCAKKHVMKEVTFSPGETQEFRRRARGQCGCRFVGGVRLKPGVYTLQLDGCDPIAIEVAETSCRDKSQGQDFELPPLPSCNL